MSEVSAEKQELASRSNAIEGAYEFFLAYASQGLSTESGAGHQVRDYLGKFDVALTGLAAFLGGCVVATGLDLAPYRGFMKVIERDALDAQAARPRAAVDHLSDDRQPQREHPHSRAAYGFIPLR